MELGPGFNPGHFIVAWALFGQNRLDEAEKIAHEALIRDPRLALAHLLLAQIYIRRSDYSEELVELDAYLRLEPVGPLSDQVREAQEYAKRKLAGLWSLSRRTGQTLGGSTHRSEGMRVKRLMKWTESASGFISYFSARVR